MGVETAGTPLLASYTSWLATRGATVSQGKMLPVHGIKNVESIQVIRIGEYDW